MARTDETAIGLVIEVDSAISLTGFIRTAYVMVNNLVTCATSKGITVDSETLTEIETWLAAHLYALRDPQYQSKQTEKASATFQGKTGKRLDSTYWGQTALALDPSGCLATMSEGSKVVGGFWLGKAPSEQINYVDRD